MTLEEEVRLYVQSAKNRGETIQASWVTNAIVKNHPSIEGDDSDWYTFCAHQAVRAAVRSVMRKDRLTEEEPDPRQTVLGFKRLQKYYLVKRDSDMVCAPIDGLSESEINDKVAELESMGRGCFLHAKELKRYFDNKEQVM